MPSTADHDEVVGIRRIVVTEVNELIKESHAKAPSPIHEELKVALTLTNEFASGLVSISLTVVPRVIPSVALFKVA